MELIQVVKQHVDCVAHRKNDDSNVQTGGTIKDKKEAVYPKALSLWSFFWSFLLLTT